LRRADGTGTNVTTARRSDLQQQKNTRWVFAYGSLIWRPGFEFVSQSPARLVGAHRRLCVLSFRHRGTEARPGLVFGLVRGGSCQGVVFEVAEARWDDTAAYLHEREMDRGVYREATRPVRRTDGTVNAALAFVVDEHHPQFAGRLSIDEQVQLVRGAVGESGANPDYVRETARHLALIGIRDPQVEALVAALDAADAHHEG
jgi:cation transport protein ChaC